MAADSVRMEMDAGGTDDTAIPLLDNFDSLESKVRCPPLPPAACVTCTFAGTQCGSMGFKHTWKIEVGSGGR